MSVTTPLSTAPTGQPRRRGLSITLGVVLCVEAFVSPIAYWGTFLLVAFLSADESEPSWSVVMGRLGIWGVALIFVVLVGAAVVLFARPSRYRLLAGALCLGAGILNLLPAVALVTHNTASNVGRIVSRLAGVGFGVAFVLVAGCLFVEGVGYLQRWSFGGAALPSDEPS